MSFLACCALRNAKQGFWGFGEEDGQRNLPQTSSQPEISREVRMPKAKMMDMILGARGRALGVLRETPGISIHSGANGFIVTGDAEAVVDGVADAIKDLSSSEAAPQALLHNQPSKLVSLPQAEDKPGNYRIVLEAFVTPGSSPPADSAALASCPELSMGTVVNVLEVVRMDDINRVRGRIAAPTRGWISLYGLGSDANWCWARKIQDVPRLDLSKAFPAVDGGILPFEGLELSPDSEDDEPLIESVSSWRLSIESKRNSLESTKGINEVLAYPKEAKVLSMLRLPSPDLSWASLPSMSILPDKSRLPGTGLLQVASPGVSPSPGHKVPADCRCAD